MKEEENNEKALDNCNENDENELELMIFKLKNN